MPSSNTNIIISRIPLILVISVYSTKYHKVHFWPLSFAVLVLSERQTRLMIKGTKLTNVHCIKMSATRLFCFFLWRTLQSPTQDSVVLSLRLCRKSRHHLIFLFFILGFTHTAVTFCKSFQSCLIRGFYIVQHAELQRIYVWTPSLWYKTVWWLYDCSPVSVEMQAEPFVKYHLRWGGIISTSSSATMIFVALTNSYYVLVQDKNLMNIHRTMSRHVRIVLASSFRSKSKPSNLQMIDILLEFLVWY